MVCVLEGVGVIVVVLVVVGGGGEGRKLHLFSKQEKPHLFHFPFSFSLASCDLFFR